MTMEQVMAAPNVSRVGTDEVHRGHPFTAEPFPLCAPTADFRPAVNSGFRVTDLPVNCVKCGGDA